jgi:hypothetical protein
MLAIFLWLCQINKDKRILITLVPGFGEITFAVIEHDLKHPGLVGELRQI